MEAYARENGFTNIRHYTDDGYSGGTFDRPGWQLHLIRHEAEKMDNNKNYDDISTTKTDNN